MNQKLIDFIMNLDISEKEKVELFGLIKKENKISVDINFTNATFNLIEEKNSCLQK